MSIGIQLGRIFVSMSPNGNYTHTCGFQNALPCSLVPGNYSLLVDPQELFIAGGSQGTIHCWWIPRNYSLLVDLLGNINSDWFPANTRRSPIVGSMLVQRRRRWANIEPTMGEHLVFAGLTVKVHTIIISYMLS